MQACAAHNMWSLYAFFCDVHGKSASVTLLLLVHSMRSPICDHATSRTHKGNIISFCRLPTDDPVPPQGRRAKLAQCAKCAKWQLWRSPPSRIPKCRRCTSASSSGASKPKTLDATKKLPEQRQQERERLRQTQRFPLPQHTQCTHAYTETIVLQSPT